MHTVTLATPFINVAPRNLSYFARREGENARFDENYLVLGVFFYLVLGTVWAITNWQVAFFAALTLPTIALTAWALSRLSKTEPFFERALTRVVTLVRDRGVEIADRSTIRPRPGTLLVMRATGDEASTALAVSQFLTWVGTLPLRLLGSIGSNVRRVEDWAVQRRLPIVLGTLAMDASVRAGSAAAGLSGEAVDNALGAMSTLLFLIFGSAFRVPSLLIEPVLTITGSVCSFLTVLPYGLDLAVGSMFTRVSVESSPLGTWRVATVAAGDSGLAHSQLYNGASLAYYLRSMLNEARFKSDSGYAERVHQALADMLLDPAKVASDVRRENRDGQ